jgi:rubrerythrin
MTAKERSKARYLYMVSNHICPMCGYALPKDYYYVYCEYCRQRKAYYTKVHKPRFFKEKLDKGGF